MKTRYRLTCRGSRGGKFYCVDTQTGRRASLQTRNEDEARQIVQAKNQAQRQADFAMSKIATAEKYSGNLLRKAIDYFCHLSVAPEFYGKIKERDKEFAATEYFQKMAWLRKENDDIYDPSYTDMLRVAFTSEFKRGKLQDLVALLSGRNFGTKQYEEKIAEESFGKLQRGVLNFINETHFKRFVMIMRDYRT
jgi:hypothetical protein